MVGIDPSPRGTALVALNGKTPIDVLFFTEVMSAAKKYSFAILIPKVERNDENSRMERLQVQRDGCKKFVKKHNPNYIAYEDYILESSGGVYQIAELGGVLRLWLWERGFKIRTYQPGSVKLAWAGKGDANKDEMIGRAYKYLEQNPSGLNDELLKMPKKYFEGIADALANVRLLSYELKFRAGKIQLSEMPENIVRVFNRVTQFMPMCLIDRPWLEVDHEAE
jgi:Holliday junction resolvasome RuvABC endonuclease subunit